MSTLLDKIAESICLGPTPGTKSYARAARVLALLKGLDPDLLLRHLGWAVEAEISTRIVPFEEGR